MNESSIGSTVAGGGDVKWFQCDSNEPNKPAVKAIMRAGVVAPEAHQAAFGALILLACYVAAYGEQEPGVGVKADGQPLNLREMASECHFRDTDSLRRFLGECAEQGHVDSDAWLGKGIVVLPEMRKRADNYTKRALRESSPKVRTPAAQQPNLPVMSCTVPEVPEVHDLSGSRDTGSAGLPLGGEDQVDGLIKAWNDEAHASLPRVRNPGPARRGVYARALRNHPDLAKWRLVIRHLNSSQWWLHGGKEHPNWRGDLDYLCQSSGSKFERQLAKYEADQRAAGSPQRGQRIDAQRGRVIPVAGKYNGTEH